MADPKTNGPDGAQLLRRAEEAIEAAGDAVEAAVLHIERPAGERLKTKLEDVERPLRAALATPTQQEQPRCGGKPGLPKLVTPPSTPEMPWPDLIDCPGCVDCQPECRRCGGRRRLPVAPGTHPDHALPCPDCHPDHPAVPGTDMANISERPEPDEKLAITPALEHVGEDWPAEVWLTIGKRCTIPGHNWWSKAPNDPHARMRRYIPEPAPGGEEG